MLGIDCVLEGIEVVGGGVKVPEVVDPEVVLEGNEDVGPSVGVGEEILREEVVVVPMSAVGLVGKIEELVPELIPDSAVPVEVTETIVSELEVSGKFPEVRGGV